jgi:hypothetical protein
MELVWASDNAFGLSAGNRDDNVKVRKIERLEGQRHQPRQRTMTRAQESKVIEKAGSDGKNARPASRSKVIDGSKKRRFWESGA